MKFLWQKLGEALNFSDSKPVDDWTLRIPPEQMAIISGFWQNEEKAALFFYVTSRSPLEVLISDDPAKYPGPECFMIPYLLKTEQEKAGVTPTNMETTLASGVIYGDPVQSFYRLFDTSYSQVVQSAIDQSDPDVNKKELSQVLAAAERKAQTISQAVAATAKAVALEPPNSPATLRWSRLQSSRRRETIRSARHLRPLSSNGARRSRTCCR